MNLPSEGTRLNYCGHLGTIRFIGEVDNTLGTWLGVEWDNPGRGKHDGSKGGKRYFSCRGNAGSFIRPSPQIIYGVPFLEALSSKYIEAHHGSSSQEEVLLGSSQGAIKVEAVGLDKIRGRLAHLDRLREVSLDKENVASGSPPGTIRDSCPNIRGLDLSTSLLPGWDSVAQIAIELPMLQRLALNRNRLERPFDPDRLKLAFCNLIELQLNATLTTWPEMQMIIANMPKLQVVEMGHNQLEILPIADPALTDGSSVLAINLDSNKCQNWIDLCCSVAQYKLLQRIVLTNNGIESIPFPENDSQSQLGYVKHISLSFNRLSGWSDVDALSRWCPALRTLTLAGNPLMESLGQHGRPFTVARIPTLDVLDGAAISSRERIDCELFYMSQIAQSEIATEDERCQAHPRWQELCQKHGRPDLAAPKGKASRNKLSSRLIELNMYRSASPKPNYPHSATDPITLRVLPSTSLQILRRKVCKIMGYHVDSSNILLWLMQDKEIVELKVGQDDQSLDWVGLEMGSNILFHILDKNSDSNDSN
ncbi:hypothetical protein BD779DRAFT_1621101 [Infundibulicybe gibba]|nr:hypothetical protein BD779DRAFT_1621101 [Infundibulicybe gibba]